MKNNGMWLCVWLAFGMIAGCDEEDPADNTETGGPGDPDGGGGNGGNGGGDDNGANEGESAGPGGDCSMDSPEGRSCDQGGDCSVACTCAAGVVDAGQCINGGCADPADVCAEACESFERGPYSGSYCALPSNEESGGDDDAGDGGAQCIPTGDACDINGDCCGFAAGDTLCVGDTCSDLCVFDSDCVSGCCMLLNTGGAACAPSSFCE